MLCLTRDALTFAGWNKVEEREQPWIWEMDMD